MSGRGSEELDQQRIDSKLVEQYLKTHPKFFQQRAALLEVLRIPHGKDGTVSLIERQIQVLREKNHQLECKLMDLVEMARDNEGLSSRLHRLALGLMGAVSLDEVLLTTTDLLKKEFHAVEVIMKLFTNDRTLAASDTRFVLRDDAGVEAFSKLFKNKHPICGRLSKKQLKYLYPEGADQVASAVVIPLYYGIELGLLALSSQEERHFYPDMGTLFLGYLGELISRAIDNHLASNRAA